MARREGHEGEIFSRLPLDARKPADPLGVDGVSCTLCHQFSSGKLGARETFSGRFVIDNPAASSQRTAYGPFAIDAGRARVMNSSSGFRPQEAEHIRRPEVCASCHTLFTRALGSGSDAAGEFPEQTPYLEWRRSGFSEGTSCQDCHMPAVAEKVPITSVLGQAHEDVSQHVFVGGNAFMQRLLSRFREELRVVSPSRELEMAALKTTAHLQSEAARVSIESAEVRDGRVAARVSVENLAGHKLPTAYPSRRAWLHVVVRERGGNIVFESGGWDQRGAIRGNDNDEDPSRYEPHYAEITEPGQVQIYESIMVDAAGAVTTGLLRGVRYVKDNRLLPMGFDKRGAGPEIAVAGGALGDEDFEGGGDGIRYSVSSAGAQGPFVVEAALCYQPIGFRWAENFQSYKAEEPRRFLRFYRAAAAGAVVVIAAAKAQAPAQ